MNRLIDIGASGLHPDSYPIEIAILIDGKTHEWLIKSLDSWEHWDPNLVRQVSFVNN